MLLKRHLEKDILSELDSPRALFILGSRRCGKTSLMERIREQLPENSTSLYLDFEDPNNKTIVQSGVNDFLAYISSLGYKQDERVFVFMDEIQYLKDFASFVKLLVDHHSRRIKLILSGSSAAQIKFQFKDSLVGRKFIYELYPLTFREFLLFKNEKNLLRLLGVDRQSADVKGMQFFMKNYKRYFEDYLIFGGFPEVVLTQDISKKQKLLQEIVNAYVLKDIRNIFNLEKIDSFNRMVKVLALQMGQLLNTSSIAKECKITRITTDKYVNILEDSFIIKRIPPLFTNKKKELRRQPKIYFHDNGLRNVLLQNLVEFSLRSDKGPLLENVVFQSLWKNRDILDSLYFWRTKDGKEVDFILQKGVDYIPFEVKVKRTAVNHLKRFGELYNSSELNLVRLEPGTVSEGSCGQTATDIRVLHPWVL